MERLQVIRPGDDQLTRLRDMMLDAGWTTMHRRGFAYVLTQEDEHVYAIPSGWVCHAGEDDSWIDPILDTYGEGWLEEQPLPDGSAESDVLRLFADIVLDEIGRRVPYRAGVRVDEHDIDRFDARTGEWIRTVDDLIDMCNGRCDADDLIQLQQEWENARANLVRAHEPVNEKVLDRGFRCSPRSSPYATWDSF